MIAISAVRAICAPNVGPIEFAEKLARGAPKSSSSAGAHLVHLLRLQRGGGDLEDVAAQLGLVDLLDLGVAVAERRERVAHLVHAGRLLQRRLDPRARLEVDAELQAQPGDRERAGHQDQARGREEPLRPADEVELPAALRSWPAPMREARADQPRAAHRAEDGRGGEHRGEQRDDRADAQREREALDAGRGEREQDERDADRHDVGVDDRAQRLRVAARDGGRDRSARRAPPPSRARTRRCWRPPRCPA